MREERVNAQNRDAELNAIKQCRTAKDNATCHRQLEPARSISCSEGQMGIGATLLVACGQLEAEA
jgi:hypothetical protein